MQMHEAASFFWVVSGGVVPEKTSGCPSLSSQRGIFFFFVPAGSNVERSKGSSFGTWFPISIVAHMHNWRRNPKIYQGCSWIIFSFLRFTMILPLKGRMRALVRDRWRLVWFALYALWGFVEGLGKKQQEHT